LQTEEAISTSSSVPFLSNAVSGQSTKQKETGPLSRVLDTQTT
jgi:hypothetical protein